MRNTTFKFADYYCRHYHLSSFKSYHYLTKLNFIFKLYSRMDIHSRIQQQANCTYVNITGQISTNRIEIVGKSKLLMLQY